MQNVNDNNNNNDNRQGIHFEQRNSLYLSAQMS